MERLDAETIRRDLAGIGLARGDRVVVHSSLRALGRVEGGAETAVDALLGVLGPQGTLVVPAFNYRPGPTGAVDLATMPGATGALAEAARGRADAHRSDHPTHSVVAIGADATALVANHCAGRAMGPGSPLGRLAAEGGGGGVLLLGVGHTSNTTVHVGEEHAGVPKPPPPEGLPTVAVRTVDGRALHCTLDTSPSCSAAFGAVEAALRERGAITDGLVGAALSQYMRGQAVIDAVRALVRRRGDALLCSRPSCGPCARSRAALNEV